MLVSSKFPDLRLKQLGLLLVLASLVACSGGNRRAVYQSGAIESQFMAEIAVQRQEYKIAAQEYVRVAQRSDDVAYAERATEFAYKYGLDAHALTAAQRWTQLEPDNRRAHDYLGRLYVKRNLLAAAFASLDIAMGPPADRLEIQYAALAVDLAEESPAERALEIFGRFAEQDASNPGILRTMASLAVSAGNTSQAVELAREAISLAPGWPAARIMLANVLLADGDRASAFEQMAFVVEGGKRLETELEYVRLLNAAGESEEALERLSRMTDRYSAKPELLLERAATHRNLQDFESATNDYQQLVNKGVFVDVALWELGRIAFEQKNYEVATGYFKSIHAGRLYLPALFAKAGVYQAQGDLPSALQVLDEFAERNPERFVDTLTTRISLLQTADKPVEAMSVVDVALEYRPWSIGLWLSKGDIWDDLGEYRKSIDAFRQAHALAPENALVLNALGYTLANRTRRHDEAAEYITQALDKQPENPAIVDSMGWVLFKQKKYDAAQIWLERAYELWPDAEIAAHLGELYWRQKKREQAAEVWQDAAAQFPDNVALQETMRRFKQ